jgi:hypothetical protein
MQRLNRRIQELEEYKNTHQDIAKKAEKAMTSTLTGMKKKI